MRNRYVGIPFKDGGRDSNGYDCWGLVKAYFMLERGIMLPDYAISAYDSVKADQAISRDGCGDWEPLLWGELRKDDVVTFKMDIEHPDLTTHCGVCLDHTRFLHCMQKTGVVISTLENVYFKARFSKGFRWTGFLD